MEQNITISVQVAKLLEWLMSRHVCKHEWQPEIVKIRAKINSAIQDMPAHKAITSLLSGTYINYFHCLKIVEILETTEADSKNIFGRYSSKRMKDWQEIVSLYKKNNVYMAEAADLLINTVKYEVPNMKKLISKQEQIQNDSKKKETDSIKSSNTARNDLKAFLKEVGLEAGEGSYRKRLIENANQLNETHEKIVSATKDLLPTVEHYTNFTALSLPQQSVNLNLIKYIAEKGNTTVYELENGEPPAEIKLPPSVFVEEEPELAEDEIDWGNDGITALENDQVDEIDWGTEGGVEADENNQEAITGKVASGEKALTILDNLNKRTLFINQLLELRSFLKTRLMEAKKEGPIDDLVESVDILAGMHSTVDSVLQLLLSKSSQHFFNILYQPKYLDTLLSKIQEKEDSIERWLAISKLSQGRAVEAAAEASFLTNKAKTLVRKARELQEEVKGDISSRYNGRSVVLMGGPAF